MYGPKDELHTLEMELYTLEMGFMAIVAIGKNTVAIGKNTNYSTLEMVFMVIAAMEQIHRNQSLATIAVVLPWKVS